uniref:SWIM-type domain-containing protein n=1 Tax=Lactuca sativa TaxID=4236 RepID=A0A9R1UUM5_LACSA|nr:hypothetical protein LSAT_V11C800440840 [Lactuca sativa]
MLEKYHEQFVVNTKERTCTCRKWDLISIPCNDVVVALYDMTGHVEEVRQAYDWVDLCYCLGHGRKCKPSRLIQLMEGIYGQCLMACPHYPSNTTK